MTDQNGEKKLMDGYVGIKFEARKLEPELPEELRSIFTQFKKTCDLLKKHEMTPANGGNISVRAPADAGQGGRFLITAAGCNMGLIEPKEMILVKGCEPQAGRVAFCGPMPPSSESLMHYLIYQARPEVGAIVHAHDEPATRPELLIGELEQTTREAPYGTYELAELAIEAIKDDRRIIVLRRHGYVAVGKDLAEAVKIVIQAHLRLGKKAAG